MEKREVSWFLDKRLLLRIPITFASAIAQEAPRPTVFMAL
jgi:hypothetical protein